MMKLGAIIGTASILLSAVSNAASLDFVSSSPIGPTSTEPGFSSPGQGDYAPFTNTQNIALGATVTVSGTCCAAPTIHNSIFLTDGNYGNGRSWIADSQISWLTIDLGSSQSFSTLSFGRDRLGNFDDRDPGQFIILTSNDNNSFTPIFDSSDFVFSGILGLGQTVQATFDTATARYVRLELAADGLPAAIDEIEINAVPLPAAAWLFGSALLGLGVVKRKRT